MSLGAKINISIARVKKAREFYKMNQPWSRNLAWKILEEIAMESPGCYTHKHKLQIAAAVEEGDMYTAFSILGDCAKMAIADMKIAKKERYQ